MQYPQPSLEEVRRALHPELGAYFAAEVLDSVELEDICSRREEVALPDVAQLQGQRFRGGDVTHVVLCILRAGTALASRVYRAMPLPQTVLLGAENCLGEGCCSGATPWGGEKEQRSRLLGGAGERTGEPGA